MLRNPPNQFTEQNFLKQQHLGNKTLLVTETPHPLTNELSAMCNEDLSTAFTIFKQVELNAVTQLLKYTDNIKTLQIDVEQAFKRNAKIYLVGCGSSGRLAMLLKRQMYLINSKYSDLVISVSAGGDVSLIRAVEQFEDSNVLGVEQLLYQGYTANDLVICISATGNAPFVTNIIDYVAKKSKIRPWLVCTNSADSLVVKDKNYALYLKQMNHLALEVGPMLLTGSTRLQATTVMQIALGIALGISLPTTTIKASIDNIINLIASLPLTRLVPFTVNEATIIDSNQFILYQTNDTLLGLNILADLTERAPTFSCNPFENITSLDLQHLSSSYMNLTTADSVAEVWLALFGKSLCCLNLTDLPITTIDYLNGFDLSNNSSRVNSAYLPSVQHNFNWQITDDNLHLALNKVQCNVTLPTDVFARSIIYKILLNSHSTLVAGRLNYFSGNIMLSVNPSNFKLVDRVIRIANSILVSEHNLKIDYQQLSKVVFMLINNRNGSNQSIVKQLVHWVLTNGKHE
jgi:N-acetylmuramic acid 6-phosphate etherase